MWSLRTSEKKKGIIFFFVELMLLYPKFLFRTIYQNYLIFYLNDNKKKKSYTMINTDYIPLSFIKQK